MATYRINGFQFNRANVAGLDGKVKAACIALMAAREREICTIETHTVLCADGPFEGQTIELSEDGQTAELSIRGWVGHYNGSKWHGTKGQLVNVIADQTNLSTAQPEVKAQKGFTAFNDLLSELGEDFGDRVVETLIDKSVRAKQCAMDDFGLSVTALNEFAGTYAITQHYAPNPIVKMTRTRSGRLVRAKRTPPPASIFSVDTCAGNEGNAYFMDDFGDLQEFKNAREIFDAPYVAVSRRITFSIGRTSYTIAATSQAVANLRARLVKAKKHFADKWISAPRPAQTALEIERDIAQDAHDSRIAAQAAESESIQPVAQTPRAQVAIENIADCEPTAAAEAIAAAAIEAASESSRPQATPLIKIEGFLQASAMTAMRKGQAEKALRSLCKYENKYMTCAQWIELLVLRGGEVASEEVDKLKPMSRKAYECASWEDQEADDERVKNGGKKTAYSVGPCAANASEYAYAQYLIATQAMAAEPQELAEVCEVQAVTASAQAGQVPSIPMTGHATSAPGTPAGQTVQGKSGNWTARLYRADNGRAVLHFESKERQKPVNLEFDDGKDRMDMLKSLAIDADHAQTQRAPRPFTPAIVEFEARGITWRFEVSRYWVVAQVKECLKPDELCMTPYKKGGKHCKGSFVAVDADKVPRDIAKKANAFFVQCSDTDNTAQTSHPAPALEAAPAAPSPATDQPPIMGCVSVQKPPLGGCVSVQNQNAPGCVSVQPPKLAITLTRAEGMEDECGQPVTVASFDAANAVLQDWSKTAPATGGYDKCDFSVIWPDGSDYEGCYDLKHRSIQPASLTAHMVDQAEYMTGQHCPVHMGGKQFRATHGRASQGPRRGACPGRLPAAYRSQPRRQTVRGHFGRCKPAHFAQGRI